MAHSLDHPARRGTLSILSALAALQAGLAPGLAHADTTLPGGGSFATGAGAIVAGASTLDINQSTPRAVINWNSFSIGAGATVNFNNAGGATLNRVVQAVPSDLLGTLTSSGSVYIINPAGIVFGKGSRVDTAGSFIATTLDLSDSSFMSGGSFVFSGGATTAVVNLGTISSSGGDVVLMARDVSNQGAISAAGTVGLASGSQILLKDSGSDQRVFVQSGAGGSLTTSGKITATQAELRAVGGNIYALAGNDGGLIAATGTAVRDGHVWLVADGGDTQVSGTITARNAGDSGGAIETSGTHVDFAGATIDAGIGGKWLLDPGTLTLDSAAVTTIQNTLGGGTDVTQTTDSSGGDGNITVASNIAWTSGATLTLSAYRSVLLNANVTIANGTSGTTGSGKLVLRADNTGSGTGSVTFGSGSKVDFSNSTGQVQIIYNPLDGAVKSTVNATRFTVTKGYSGGSNGYASEVALGSKGATLVAAMLVNSAEDLQNIQNNLSASYYVGPAVLDASATAGWNSGAGFQPIGSSATPFTGSLYGGNNAIDQLTIAQSGGSNIGLFAAIGNTGLVRDLSLTGASITGSSFVGALAGTSNGKIVNVSADGSVNGDAFVGGIVGETDGAGALIDQVTSAVSVNGTQNFIGGVVGLANAGSITATSNSGSVGGDLFVGGVAGVSYATASNLSNSGTVTGDSSSTDIGGVVGGNFGSLTSATNTGNVSGSFSVGGVVGENDGSLTLGKSTGTITGFAIGTNAGGLVGTNVGTGTISQSYTEGTVTTAASFGGLGGLVGKNDGSIVQSFNGATVQSGSDNVGIGGLVGQNLGTINQSASYNRVVAGTNATNVGGLVGENQSGGKVLQSYTITYVSTGSGANQVGGLVGKNSGTVSADSFWDVGTTGQASGAGVGTAVPAAQGLTTVAAQDKAGLSTLGYNFTSGPWGIIDGKTYPYPTWYFPTAPDVVSGTSFKDLAGTVGNPGAIVSLSVGGVEVARDDTYANGFFYLLGPSGTVTDGSLILARLPTGSIKSNAVEVVAGGTATGMNLYSGAVALYGNGSPVKLSDLGTALGSLTGADIIYSASATAITPAAGRSLLVFGGQSAVELDRSVTTTGAGLISVRSSNALTIDSGVLLNSAFSGDAISLVTSGAFTNNEGADALTASSGRWIVSSADPSLDTVGGLSPDFIQYSAVYPATAVAGTGNGFLYSLSPKLTVTLKGTVTKVYDATTAATLSASNYTVSGGISGDTIVFNNPTAGTFDTKNVGTGKTVSVTGLGVTATRGALPIYGYQFTSDTVSGTIGAITAKQVTAGLTGTVSKIYDATTTATLAAGNYTLGGVITGDTVGVATTAGTYDTKNVGTGKTVSVTGLTLGGADAGNYALASTSTSGTVGTITAATLTAGLTGTVSKVYDATTTASLVAGNYTLGGVITGDTVTLNNPAPGTYDTKNVGAGKTVSVTGLALGGADAGNYALASTSTSGNVGTITAKQLTAGLTGTVSKVYDATTTATLAAGNYTLGGVITGDTVGVTNTAGTYDTKNVGTGKTVSVTGLALGGADAGNYALASTSTSGTVGTITAATLTAGLTGTVSKVYDATTTASLVAGNYTLGGVITGDTVTLNNPTSGSYDTKNVGTGKTVSVTGLALGGADAGNYALAASSVSASIGAITAKQLTAGLTGTVSKVYDATTTASLVAGNYTLGGVITGDTVTLNNPSTGSYDTKNVGTGKTVSVTGLALGGTDADNYALASTSTSGTVGTITAKQLTAGLTGTVSKVYDATTTATLAAGNYTLGGVITGDTVGVTTTAGTYDTKNVGTGKTVSVTGLALGGADAGNYALASTSTSGTIGTITAKQLTAGLTGTVSKVYDATTTASLVAGNYTLGGVITGDTVGVSTTAGTYDTKNVGTGKTVSVTGLALGGADAGNYALASTSTSGTIGTITAKQLTAGLTGTVSKVYDATTTATLAAGNYTLGGVITGDTVGVTTTAGSYDTKNVGTGKTVSVTGLALGGADAGNYALASTSTSGTVGTITAATLTAGLTGTVSKVYDATTTASLVAGNYTLGGVITGDTVTLNNPTSGSYDTKNVGTGKTVSVTGLALGGADAGNYALASTSTSGSVGTITAKQLTAGLTGTVSKVYDATTTATLAAGNYTLGGVITGDTVGVTNTAGTYDTKNVGTGKTVSVTGLALGGADAGNYALASTSTSGTVGTITAATLTAGLTGTVSKVYDATTTASLVAGNYTLGGVITGDTVTLNNPASGSYDTKNVGTGKTVSVTGLALGGADAGNYALAASNVSASIGAITAKQLTAGLTGTVSKVYDATTTASLVAGNYTLGGVITGDTVTLNNPASGSYDTKNVGTGKTVSVTGLALGGADAGNYALASTSTSGTVGTITAKQLTAGLTGTVSKVYDATTTATLAAGNYTLGGVITGDTVGVTTTAGTYDTKNVGTGKTVSVTGLALGGADAGNYALASTSTSGSVGTITAKQLTAGLTGTVSKVYDATTAATLAAGNYTLGGVITGDTVGVSATASTYDTKNVGTGKTVSVTGLALGGADAGNYALASTSTSGTIGTITAKQLTAGLTGTVSKVYDATTKATLSAGNYTLGGVITGDTVGVTTTAGSYDTKNVGTGKTVSATGLALGGADAGNYALASTNASGAIGTITAAPLSITVNDANRFVNLPNPDFTVTYTGFVGTETASALSGSLQFSTAANIASQPGVYPVSASGLTSSNYRITYVDGKLTVRARLSQNSNDGTTPTDFITNFIFDPIPNGGFGGLPGGAGSGGGTGEPGDTGNFEGDWSNDGQGGSQQQHDLAGSGPN